jgi:5-(carboxyamino)imidazole ribonucleotide synthase
MVGAGQLARMTAQAAVSLGIRFRVLAGSAADSAAQVCPGTQVGDYRNLADLLSFAAGCDVVTFDHEHVPAARLAALSEAAQLRPGPDPLRYTQDKRAMRERLGELGIPCPRFRPVATAAQVEAFAAETGWPVVLKAVSGGYDGKGVWTCASTAEAAALLDRKLDLLAEERVAFDRELAVLVARSPRNQGAAYPVVQTVQRDGICREVIAPAPGLSPGLAVAAQRLGLRLAAELGVTGLLAVELFESSGALLVNELAMRPHNCGHWTIDGAVTSQFEQHLRAVLDLPLGAPAMTARCAVMANILGADGAAVHHRLPHVMAADPGARVHLYGKDPRPGRKIGHVTVTGDDPALVRARACRAASYLSTGMEARGT